MSFSVVIRPGAAEELGQTLAAVVADELAAARLAGLRRPPHSFRWALAIIQRRVGFRARLDETFALRPLVRAALRRLALASAAAVRVLAELLAEAPARRPEPREHGQSSLAALVASLLLAPFAPPATSGRH